MNYKFRGKTAGGVWKHGSYVGVRGNSYIVDDEYGISWDVRPETVGQWTGRLDKNGKEIYADDFIKYPTAYNCPDPYFVGRIVFEGGAWKIENSNPLYDYYERSVEICGNKFDNPELLEDK